MGQHVQVVREDCLLCRSDTLPCTASVDIPLCTLDISTSSDSRAHSTSTACALYAVAGAQLSSLLVVVADPESASWPLHSGSPRRSPLTSHTLLKKRDAWSGSLNHSIAAMTNTSTCVPGLATAACPANDNDAMQQGKLVLITPHPSRRENECRLQNSGHGYQTDVTTFLDNIGSLPRHLPLTRRVGVDFRTTATPFASTTHREDDSLEWKVSHACAGEYWYGCGVTLSLVRAWQCRIRCRSYVSGPSKLQARR